MGRPLLKRTAIPGYIHLHNRSQYPEAWTSSSRVRGLTPEVSGRLPSLAIWKRTVPNYLWRSRCRQSAALDRII